MTHRPATLRPINLWCGFILAAALAGPASADDGLSTLTRWLAPGADVVARLTRSPGECLAPGDDDQARYLIAIGRAAFRTPFLLGGQAARGGLSCNACHIDGGDNPDFFLRGLSGALHIEPLNVGPAAYYASIGRVDLMDRQATLACFNSLGKIDVLVNIAGGFSWERVQDGSLDTWDFLYAVKEITERVRSYVDQDIEATHQVGGKRS